MIWFRLIQDHPGSSLRVCAQTQISLIRSDPGEFLQICLSLETVEETDDSPSPRVLFSMRVTGLHSWIHPEEAELPGLDPCSAAEPTLSMASSAEKFCRNFLSKWIRIWDYREISNHYTTTTLLGGWSDVLLWKVFSYLTPMIRTSVHPDVPQLFWTDIDPCLSRSLFLTVDPDLWPEAQTSFWRTSWMCSWTLHGQSLLEASPFSPWLKDEDDEEHLNIWRLKAAGTGISFQIVLIWFHVDSVFIILVVKFRFSDERNKRIMNVILHSHIETG